MRKRNSVGLLLCIVLVLLILPGQTAEAGPSLPWVDDMTTELSDTVQQQVQMLQYKVLEMLAQLQWFLMKGLFLLGYILEAASEFLQGELFKPMIATTNDSVRVAVSLSFVVSLFILAMCYFLAHIFRFHVVDLKSAVMWYLLTALFFQIGPTLYVELNNMRASVNSAFYMMVLDGVNDQGSPFESLASVPSDSQYKPFPICDNFGPFLPNHTQGLSPKIVDGLDVAMSYMMATPHDVMGREAYPVAGGCMKPNMMTFGDSLPFYWYFRDGYFDKEKSPPAWEFMTPSERDEAIDQAAKAQYRMIGAWSIIWFGVFEKATHLLLTLALAIGFISFPVAAIFAFFKRTEAIAQSVVDLWLEILIQSIALGIMQALVVAFALSGAATENPLVMIGIGLMCAILSLVMLFSAAKMLWNSINRLMQAIGQATGGAMMSPTSVGLAALGTGAAIATGGATLAGAGVFAGANAATSGAATVARGTGRVIGGASAWNAGASGMQVAGVVFGGNAAMSDAARTLAMMPSTRNTVAGHWAKDFTLGSSSVKIADSLTPSLLSPVAPVVGGAMLLPKMTQEVEAPSRAGGSTGKAQPKPSNSDHSTEGLATAQTVKVEANLPGLLSGENKDAYLTGTTNFTPFPGQNTQAEPQKVPPFIEQNLDAAIEEDNKRDDAAADRESAEIQNAIRDTGSNRQIGEVKVDTSGIDQAGRTLTEAGRSLEQIAVAMHQERIRGQIETPNFTATAAFIGQGIEMTRHDMKQQGVAATHGADTMLMTSNIARAMGSSLDHPGAPLGTQSTKVGMFANQAMMMGLDGAQSAQVIREVKMGSRIEPETREQFTPDVRRATGMGADQIAAQFDNLERLARIVPNQIRTVGDMPVQQYQAAAHAVPPTALPTAKPVPTQVNVSVKTNGVTTHGSK